MSDEINDAKKQYKMYLPSDKGLSQTECIVHGIVRAHPQWSQKRVSEFLGLDPKTIRNAMKQRLEESGPFTFVPLELFRLELSPGEILLAAVLINLEGKTGSARPSNKSLSVLLDTSVSSLQRWKSKLKKKGILELKSRFSKGWQLTNEHIISSQPFTTQIEASLPSLNFFERQKWTRKHYDEQNLNRFIRKKTLGYKAWLMQENDPNARLNPFKGLSSRIGSQIDKGDLQNLRDLLAPNERNGFDEVFPLSEEASH